ncbi:MAG: hypothetical protein J2P41_21510 [Blastocatellia bacterium]|nr:hypothetical protein [Blastocatellia bacterium]
MALKKSPTIRYRNILALGFVFLLLPAIFTATRGRAIEQKNPKPEDVVERALLAYGSRAAIYGVQKTGRIASLVKFHSTEGTREGRSILKFLRKQKMSEDLLIIELDMPDIKYMLGYDGTETWSIHDGQPQKPGPEEVNALHSGHNHGYDAILRYRENNAKLEYVGNKSYGTFLIVDIIDLVSPEGLRTRYEISRRTGRILYLDYEDKADENAEPVKYRINFRDFRAVQNMYIPYETLVFKNGTLVEERKIVEAAFNVQLDEKAFKLENANKPLESAP